jgi:aspartate aminotransferase
MALVEKAGNLKVSAMAENLIGSEIIKLAAEVNEKIRNGEKIYNLTIGDFNPKIFPIPAELKAEIIKAYQEDETNYPPADGILHLRQVVSKFLLDEEGLEYGADQILIAGGARPLIYAIFQALVDPGDTIVFPVPSWNNNHYTHLSRSKQVFVETRPENNFMPTADELAPHLKGATLLALCSPLNPTGTTFTKEGLEQICDLVISENLRRGADEKPLYLMYDQIYWTLTYGETEHYNPVTLRPELKDYTIFVDGLSKSFAATGIRVGWGFGPKKIVDKMKSILGHVGAWAPKAEQIASARYMAKPEQMNAFLSDFKKSIYARLQGFYKGFMDLKHEGFTVDAIAPQSAIYLTVKVDLKGGTTVRGEKLQTAKDVTRYILDEAKIAMVPFYAFGSSEDSPWYRISVGTCKLEEVESIIDSLRSALKQLN